MTVLNVAMFGSDELAKEMAKATDQRDVHTYVQKETKDGAPYFSLSLQDKKGSGDIAPPQQAAISQQTQEDDSKIPF